MDLNEEDNSNDLLEIVKTKYGRSNPMFKSENSVRCFWRDSTISANVGRFSVEGFATLKKKKRSFTLPSFHCRSGHFITPHEEKLSYLRRLW